MPETTAKSETGAKVTPVGVTPVEPESKPRKKRKPPPVIVCRTESNHLIPLTDAKGERLEFPSTVEAVGWCKRRLTQEDVTFLILTVQREFKLTFTTKTVATMV